MAISTLARKSGIIDNFGNIKDLENLEQNVVVLLKQHGYKMSVGRAIKKVLNLSVEMKNNLI
tara:strand:- start:1449 stop:1634 length:186 start_codon:yes stop_codon:yes gene_type:complete